MPWLVNTHKEVCVVNKDRLGCLEKTLYRYNKLVNTYCEFCLVNAQATVPVQGSHIGVQ